MLERLGLSFEGWVRRNMPDPFVLVLALTLLTFVMAGFLNWNAFSAPKLAGAWLGGFWELLSFSMQMVLIVVTGEAIIATRPVRRAFRWISDRPRTPGGALWLLSTCALAAGWLHWGFGLIGSALLARQMAGVLRAKGIRVDYPLMGTAAYLSMLLWHAGTTATAPLLINTPGHFLESTIGLIPLSETVFLPMNLAACGILFVLTPWLVVRMHPRKPRPADAYLDLADAEAGAETRPEKKKPSTLAERLDQSALLGRATGALGIAALALGAVAKGKLDLTHNIVNFLLLSTGLLIHGSPVSYARAIATSVRGTSGIILQYPFYGGIMGLMKESGLGHAIAGLFIQFSTAHTLPFFAYLAATFTKLFVPSGGGEWAVEGPVMLQAARDLGSAFGKTTMGIAYGNMVGNLFQPFWAIPLLAVLGLRARDIMGFCLVIFLFAFPILGAALLLSG
jgi:short-chain fatty acids transporter